MKFGRPIFRPTRWKRNWNCGELFAQQWVEEGSRKASYLDFPQLSRLTMQVGFYFSVPFPTAQLSLPARFIVQLIILSGPQACLVHETDCWVDRFCKLKDMLYLVLWLRGVIRLHVKRRDLNELIPIGIALHLGQSGISFGLDWLPKCSPSSAKFSLNSMIHDTVTCNSFYSCNIPPQISDAKLRTMRRIYHNEIYLHVNYRGFDLRSGTWLIAVDLATMAST